MVKIRSFVVVAVGLLTLVANVACAATPTPTPVPPTATPAPAKGAVPEEFKGTAAVMAAVTSFKIKATFISTSDGTPVAGTEERSEEIDVANKRAHAKIGDVEYIIIGKTTYSKLGKDLPWTKTEAPPQGPEESFGFEEEAFAYLTQVTVGDTEPCPRGGLCRIHTAVERLPDGEQATIKFWIGVSDNLIYKAVWEDNTAGVRTVVTTEFYDYNVPITITAPIP